MIRVFPQTRVNAPYGVPGRDGSGGRFQWEECGDGASHGNNVAIRCDSSLRGRVRVNTLALTKLEATIGLNTTVKRNKQK